MKLIDVPHYNQAGRSDCQAACAAMVMDYWLGRDNDGGAERIKRLLESFALGFRPESGAIPPAITGLVAKAIAKNGFTINFYSANADGGGIEGLRFLIEGWGFTEQDVVNYAEKAQTELRDASQVGLTIHENRISEIDVDTAIAAGHPVVAIVNLKALKNWRNDANHAVVVTGIDQNEIAIHDPADEKAHRVYDRKAFFAAHWREETDYDAYVITSKE